MSNQRTVVIYTQMFREVVDFDPKTESEDDLYEKLDPPDMEGSPAYMPNGLFITEFYKADEDEED